MRGDTAVTAERAGAGAWHAACFSCADCGAALADLLYYYSCDTDQIYCARQVFGSAMSHSARLSEKATYNFHTQESIKIENLKLKTPRQALRGSARDPALRRLRRAHLRGGVCARGAPPLARTALLLLVVRPAARRHQVRHNTRAANEISQNGNGKGNETLNMEFIQNSP